MQPADDQVCVPQPRTELWKVRSIDGFHITPRRARVIFHCTTEDDDKVNEKKGMAADLQRRRGVARRTRSRNTKKQDYRQIVTGLEEYHLLDIVDYTTDEDGNLQFEVQWCGYDESGNSMEPFHKVWECRKELVQMFCSINNLAIPDDLDMELSDTSDDEEEDPEVEPAVQADVNAPQSAADAEGTANAEPAGEADEDVAA
ncbi:hypothetical protein FGRMN_4168 [Fusarium graminum]|nr:hypothetical protein FGRMN_4168 [Fusarium graminum]